MVKMEYIDIVAYERRIPKAACILFDEEMLLEKKIVVFGTGIDAYFASVFLNRKGKDIECFVNNDKRISGKFFCERIISCPNENIWGGDFYIVIAVDNVNFVNEIIWQLYVHGIKEYALVFVQEYHPFLENGKISELQNISMNVMNKMLCAGKNISDIIQPESNVSGEMNLYRPIYEVCKTTTYSNMLMEWFYEKYRHIDMDIEKELLEISPGRGWFSAVINRINPHINIEWLMFDTEKKSTNAENGKYSWWPANMFNAYYGVLEEPEFIIDKKFDIIVLTEVMEHFRINPIQIIGKIVNMLSQDGEIYLSTPDWGHLRIYDTYGDIPHYSTKEDYIKRGMGHTYQYTKEELEDIFDACGLKIVKYGVSDGIQHNILLQRK